MKTIEEMIVSDTDRRLADTIKEVILAVSIFSEAVDVIFTVHDYSSGTLVLVSKAFTELTGIRQEDIKRGGLQVYHDMIHPKDFDLLGAAYKKSCELFTRKKKKELSYFVFTSNFRIKTVEGDYRQMDNYGVPVLTDENGYPKIGVNILRPSGRKGVDRFTVHYPESNLKLYYSGKLNSYVSEQKIKLKEIEIQILKLSAEGVNERMISRKLNTKRSLINYYKRSIFHKLFVNTMSEAIYTALTSGLI